MILVTGASGFIGHQLLTAIVHAYPNEQIVALYKQTSPNTKEGKQCSSIKWLRVDLTKRSGLEQIKTSPRIVFHLAATTDTNQSDFRCNDEGTEYLIQTLSALHFSGHLVFTSTVAVYAGRKHCQNPIDLRAKTAPNNAYGWSKYRAEHLLILASKKNHFQLSIIRLTTVYGDRARKNSIFPIVEEKIKQHSIAVRLNWPGKFGIVHVDDVVKNLVAISKKEKRNSLQISMLCAENVTLPMIVKSISKMNRTDIQILHLPERFWSWANTMRRLIKVLELFFPSPLYNQCWRASLLSENVLFCTVTINGKFWEESR